MLISSAHREAQVPHPRFDQTNDPSTAQAEVEAKEATEEEEVEESEEAEAAGTTDPEQEMENYSRWFGALPMPSIPEDEQEESRIEIPNAPPSENPGEEWETYSTSADSYN